MRPLIFLFPGQSAREAQMFEHIRAIDPVLGDAVTALLLRFGVLTERLEDSNRSIQLSVFLASWAWLQLVEGAGLRASDSSGHSLGEYLHLVHAGALSFSDVLALIEARGAAYDRGPSGVMSAVPLGAHELADALRPEDNVWISCDNSPRQVVIGGAADDVSRVSARLEEELFVISTVIESKIPMHTPRFAPVQGELLPSVERVHWRSTPRYWSNVLGRAVEEPSREIIVSLLTRHVAEPVLWRSQIEALLARYPGAIFLEVGPRRILTELLKRWRNDVSVFSVDSKTTQDAKHQFEATMRGVRDAIG